MFNKSALFLAVTLAVSIAAGPAPTTDSAPAKRGTAIPMRKRSSLTTTEGVFDHDKAIASTIFTLNKHRANLLNLQKNRVKALSTRCAFPVFGDLRSQEIN
jgi:cathepsin D